MHDLIIELQNIIVFYTKNGRKSKCAHINVTACDTNSHLLRNLNNHILHVLMIQETKLCDALPIAQFSIYGYTIYRNDYTKHAERLMIYVVDDLPERRQDYLNGYVCISGRISYIVTGLMIRGQRWLIWSVYKQPTATNRHFRVVMEHILTEG